MKSIWKFPLNITNFSIIKMPAGAEILTVQMQYGDPCIWAIVDPEAKSEQRQFHVIGTGHPFNLPEWEYIGTVQMHSGQLVWHIFETPSNHVIK